MIFFKKSSDLRNHLDSQALKKEAIGFVPTMGALHEGHLSLINKSKLENPVTVCTIFVNPAQFNDADDFNKYPVTIEQDIKFLESVHCEILFLPSIEEVYPAGINKTQNYDLGKLETVLEGKYRPGHFQGVCKVIHRFLEIVQPTNLYLGQKDYQQCKVITRLLKLLGKDDDITIKICDTLREADGLAMSSRNLRLSDDEREKASAIFESLSYIKTNIVKGDLENLKEKSATFLKEKGFEVDYIEIADAETLEILNSWDGNKKIISLVAASIGKIRLIDNMPVN